MQCRPELGSEARCPEALREERLPTWAQAAAGRAAQSPGSPSTEEAACTGTDVPPRSPSWRLLDRDTEPKRRKPPGSKNPDSRALRAWFFSSCGGILELRRGSQPSPWVGPGKPNLPLGERGGEREKEGESERQAERVREPGAEHGPTCQGCAGGDPRAATVLYAHQGHPASPATPCHHQPNASSRASLNSPPNQCPAVCPPAHPLLLLKIRGTLNLGPHWEGSLEDQYWLVEPSAPSPTEGPGTVTTSLPSCQ